MVEPNRSEPPEAFRLGVPELDGEHAVQFQLLHALEDALARADRASAATLIARLDDFTNAHFLAEQLLMLLHAYPGFQRHQQEHDQLIEDLRAIRVAIKTGNELQRDVTPESIETWLLHHIQTADRAFAAYLADLHREEPTGPLPPRG